MTELVAPHFVSKAGGSPISVTKFTNEASGTTAAHVVLGVHFSSAVNIGSGSITLLVNGSPANATGCTPGLPATGVTDVSCPVGNIAGGGKAKMTVRFAVGANTTDPPADIKITVTGSATYGEGGGTPGQPPNSVQSNTDSLTVSKDASVQGDCLDGGGTVKGTTGSQTTSATVGTAADSSLPCTFVDAGVLPNDPAFVVPGTLKSQISFVDFPALGGTGLATVKIFFTPLPAGVNNVNQITLLEDTNYAAPYFSNGHYITVPNCDRSGNIPLPVGIPAQGATDAVAHSNDSCIYDRKNATGELDLHAISSPFDSHFGT